MSRLFGTDGIRGIAYDELSVELSSKVGLALGYVLNKGKKSNTVIIGYDTRESANMIFTAIKDSLLDMGVNVMDLGVIPTPAVSYLVRKYNSDAGVMITASHNPYEYNGIKIFNSDGYKLSDELEDEIEKIINSNDSIELVASKAKILNNYNPVKDYVEYLVSTCKNINFSGIKVVIDCANGASYKTANLLFKKLNCDFKLLNNNPDGYNINDNCGSMYIDKLRDYVIKNHFDIGIAYDGDADRCLLVDHLGNIIDGDYILAIFANNYKYKSIVGTVMTNLGLIKYCNDFGINFISTKVGDRFVLEEMLKNGYKLGGEQSGHIILKDYANTGDGQLTSIKILELIKKEDKSLNELSLIMKKYPQVIDNIKVDNKIKDEVMSKILIDNDIKRIEMELGNEYRVLIRASGTEPLIRVMIEGVDKEIINKKIEEIVMLIKKYL